MALTVSSLKYFRKENNCLQIDLYGLLFWILLTITIPIVHGAIGAKQLIDYFLYISINYLLGTYIIKNIIILQQTPDFLKTGIQIFWGATINAVLFLIFGKLSIFLIVIYLVIQYLGNNINISFNKKILLEILISIPVLIIILSPEEFYLRTELHQGMTWDYTFYTAIVESLKTNHDFSNAVFQQGIPINYPSLTFIIPAAIGFHCSIPSQIALWGIFMPLLYVLSTATTSWLICKLYNKIFDKVENPSLLKLALINMMLLFWGPLHILNLANGNISESLYLGIGYLLPLGSPGYAITMFLSSMIMLLFFFKGKRNWQSTLLFISSLIFISGSKIAFALPLITFIGTFSLFDLVNKNSIRNFFIISIASILSMSIIYLFSFSFASKSISFIALDGLIINELIEFSLKYQIPSSSILISVTAALSMKLFYFLGLKLIIAIPTIKKTISKSFITQLTISLIFTLSVFLTIYLFYNTLQLNLDNTVYSDGSIDTAQFLRTIVYIINIFCICLTLRHFENKEKWRLIWGAVISVWVSLCLYSLVCQSYNSKNGGNAPEKKWYSEVVADFEEIHPKKLIMLSDGYFSGLGLTALGVHPWYIFGSNRMRDCFSTDIETLVRRKNLEDFFNPLLSKHSRKKIGQYFIRHNVDCIIENPFSQQKMNFALRDSLIQKIPNTKHFYQFTVL